MRHKPTIEPHQLHVLKEEIHKLERAVNYYKNLSDEVAGYNIMVDSQIIFLKRDLDQKKIGYEILKSLHDIIGTQIELDEFYMSTLALLLTELKMDKVVVLWKDGQHYKSRFNLGYESEAKALLERLEISLVELNSMEHAHVLLNKASTREEHHDRLCEELQLPFLVGTPIKNNEDIEGWLIAGREKEARPFYPPLMPGDLELFEVMGGFVKAVDINFRLYDDLEKANQELEEYNKSLEKKVEERTRAIEVSKKQLELEKQKTDSLLLNILPQEVANELKDFGESKARNIDGVSILFTDFVNFTHYAENMTPEELVSELHECFTAFDKIIDKYHLEKIKTIGDAYMAVGWKDKDPRLRAKNMVNAALEMQQYVEERVASKGEKKTPFSMRAGINSGPVVAGIVGVRKFQYDIWGDTVNIASRMESAGANGKVNISKATYNLIHNEEEFHFENRGERNIKGKGKMQMWFVEKH